MAVREYIGARYVMKIDGEYDPTKVYEALTVVDDGAGTSYISKVPTPAGIPLNNTTYWAVFGSSSGAIIALQNRMTAAENDILNIDTVEIPAIQGDITNINTVEIPAIQNDITNLQNALSALDDRRMVVISDSYGLVRGGNTPWVDYFQAMTGLSNTDYFAYAEGSMGFNRTGDGGHTAQTLLQAHSSDITDHNTITDVIFGLGINDMNGVAGLDTAIASCITYVKTEYPNAKIWIGYISNQETKATAAMNNYLSSLSIYKDSATRGGARYIDGVEYVMHNWKFFQSDGIHPTSDGCKTLADFINSYMLGGASYTVADTCTFTSSYLNTTYANIKQVLDGAVSHIVLTLYGFANAITIAAGAAEKIATINDPILGGSGGDSYGDLVYITVAGNLVPFRWFVYGGDLYLQNLNSAAAYTIAASTTVRQFTTNAATLIC